jgi:hypothetical protein
MSFPGNRRQADRRKADRRRPPVSTTEDGWFSAWGDPGNSGLVSRGADSALLEADPEAHGDSHFIAREAKRLVSTEGAALPRILRTYVAARAGLSLALVLAPFLASLGGGKPPVLVILVCLAYASQAMSLWLLQGGQDDSAAANRLLPRQWLWTIGVDLVAFSALRVLEQWSAARGGGQEELAGLINVSRTTLSQILQRFERGGLIAVGYRTLRIVDLPRLESLAAGL